MDTNVGRQLVVRTGLDATTGFRVRRPNPSTMLPSESENTLSWQLSCLDVVLSEEEPGDGLFKTSIHQSLCLISKRALFEWLYVTLFEHQRCARSLPELKKDK